MRFLANVLWAMSYRCQLSTDACARAANVTELCQNVPYYQNSPYPTLVLFAFSFHYHMDPTIDGGCNSSSVLGSPCLTMLAAVGPQPSHRGLSRAYSPLSASLLMTRSKFPSASSDPGSLFLNPGRLVAHRRTRALSQDFHSITEFIITDRYDQFTKLNLAVHINTRGLSFSQCMSCFGAIHGRIAKVM